MKINSLVKKIMSRLEAITSKIRGYRNSVVAGFEFRLALESSHFDYKFDFGDRQIGAQFVVWTDLVQLQIFVKILEGLVAPVVVDVGAHHGLYALLAGAYCKQVKQGKVLAFEPVTENFDILRRNIALNDLEQWVTPINKAVGENCESVRISCLGSQSQLRVHNSTNSEVVDQVDLTSELPKELQHIDILMIDVEGAELPVLKGFPWERINVSHIFCEFHPYAWNDFGYDASDMAEFLESIGYRAFDMFQENQTTCRTGYYVGPTLFRRSMKSPS